MTSMNELDPYILKALGYFRSSNSDSTERLKQMLNEALDNAKRGQDSKDSLNSGKSGKSSLKPIKIGELKKKDNNMLNKRPYDRIQKDLEELNEDTVKKAHIDALSPASGMVLSQSFKSTSSHDFLSPTNGAFAMDVMTSDDFELEMAGLACTVCREMTVGSGNQLVECQDCHYLYHQECHQPHISDADVNDPRCIWYCSKCKQNMKRQENQNFQSTLVAKPPVKSSNIKRDPTPEKSKVSITPFKRAEMKSNLASASNGGASMQGWAALSGKVPRSTSKNPVEHTKSSDSKPSNPHHKSTHGAKEKTKAKNHVKNNQSKFAGSDAWAEALGAAPVTPERPKQNLNKSSNTKHVSLSSASWLINPGSNTATKHKSPNPSSPSPSQKSSPFPKSSAGTAPIAKSVSTFDNAAKHMQIMKKKAAAKMQQKHTRV